ncbi:MAG: hypothetical protein MK086_13405 [Flavobacteriales bacterium]|nr:hypothetical protein [Flavobacteriales bacterium]
MRFFFIGLIIIFLASMLIGQLTTPKRTPFRNVFAKGLYYSIIGLIGFVIIIGIAALANDFVARGGSESDFERMTKDQKQVYSDSVRSAVPTPTEDELKTLFVDFNFNGVLIPCYETVHKLNVESAKEILSFETGESKLSSDLLEFEVAAELMVNQPATDFHFKGDFRVQYEFYKGDSDFPPAWNFSRILIGNCQVISVPEEKKVIGNEELYPDLTRGFE